MDPFRRASGGRPRLWDGGVGSSLVARGLDLDAEPPETWNLSRPAEVRAVHEAFARAGAEVVQTNTFGATRPRLARLLAGAAPPARPLGERLEAIVRAAVEAARASGAPFVAGSLGPTGVDPFAPDAAARIRDVFAEAIDLLRAAGVDALHLETMYHPVEARAGLAAAREVAPALPVCVSTTCALGDLGFQTPLGVALPRMIEEILDEGPDAVGLNCSLEARKMLGALRIVRGLTDLPVLVKPQAGAPTIGCRGDYRGDSPERFARDGRKLVDEGADAIGGCCGTTPEHLAALREALQGARGTSRESL